ncbi:hypothetical protein H310_00437 [Aphanomyces invadans]|uniref:Uncharacterized protein n=1 Tax=Aphanomyces invadans TaxID=157072 RepID=A0A024UWL1_9STRA|nr:hypothetical protein H310_00437 [Aphanomyces invadans]ETW10048.1 hypothetical protein H310_00437 [Aphanomyces invadans]|eukprot:XP_008861459.1 hypothetical protein H310_00437 [Aphanomyces invadans]
MSHMQNHIQIPSLKRNLSGGASNSNSNGGGSTSASSSSLNINTSSHMNMSAAASLSALANGNNNTDRSTMPSALPMHRHDPHCHGSSSSSSHPSMQHSYLAPPQQQQHDRYSIPQHSSGAASSTNNNSITSNPPTIQRAVTSSSAYIRQPLTTRVSTSVPIMLPTPGSTSMMRPTGPLGVGSTNSSAASSPVPTFSPDWRMYLTIEERQAVRSKILDAYTSTCKTYEELLHAASAIEEELLHIAAPSRLDYFKSGFEFENRVKLKREQLQGQLVAMEKRKHVSTSSSSNGQLGDGHHHRHKRSASPPPPSSSHGGAPDGPKKSRKQQ